MKITFKPECAAEDAEFLVRPDILKAMHRLDNNLCDPFGEIKTLDGPLDGYKSFKPTSSMREFDENEVRMVFSPEGEVIAVGPRETVYRTARRRLFARR